MNRCMIRFDLEEWIRNVRKYRYAMELSLKELSFVFREKLWRHLVHTILSCQFT